jgi:hypothetical protein
MAAPTHDSTGTFEASVGALTPDPPAGDAGDLLILVIETADTPASSITNWTFVTSQHASGGTLATQTAMAVFSRVADGGAGDTPTVADSGNHQYTGILRFSGQAASSPITILGEDALTTASTAVSIPAATADTPEDDCLVLAIGTTALDGTTGDFSSVANASLTGLATPVNINTDAGNGGGILIATGVKTTAGTVSSTTATLGTSSKQARITLSISPVAAGGTTVTPGVIARSFVLNAPTIKGSAVRAPAATARSFGVNAATPAVPGSTAPAATARSFTVDAPVVKGAAVTTPAATARVFTLPQADAIGDDPSATVTPDAIARAFALGETTEVGRANVQPSATGVTITLPAPEVKSPITASPAATSRSYVIPVVTTKGGSVVNPGAIARVYTVQSPTLKTSVVIEIDSIDLAAVAGQVTIITDDSGDWPEQIWIDSNW